MTKRLQSSKLNIHVHSLLLQEKQPDVIIVNDGDSSDISDKDGGKKTNVSNISSFLIMLSYTTLAKARARNYLMCLYYLISQLAKRADRYPMIFYYPTTLRSVQITPKTSNIMRFTRYFYARRPVRKVCLLLTNQLARFPAPIPFGFAYICRTFPVKKYLRNSPVRT